MFESDPQSLGRTRWHASKTPARDAIELNYGCPHGMSERGMGQRGRTGTGVLQHDYRVGDGGGEHTGDRQADA